MGCVLYAVGEYEMIQLYLIRETKMIDDEGEAVDSDVTERLCLHYRSPRRRSQRWWW